MPPPPAQKKSRKAQDEDTIVISDSEDEDEDDGGLDVEPPPVPPPPIQPARPSQPFRDGKAKASLTVLPSDKHIPVFGSQKRVGGGPKVKVKVRKP